MLRITLPWGKHHAGARDRWPQKFCRNDQSRPANFCKAAFFVHLTGNCQRLCKPAKNSPANPDSTRNAPPAFLRSPPC
ncbi:Hypothetical protein RAK1035_2655 [Roseovarius sp. AK1035]|nr:Hypothetical protein RAK1035_2655 [Roseovarius sp. AK1035]